MLHLVTGHKGAAHIKSENIKDFNRDATAYSSFTSGTFTVSFTEDSSKLKVGSGFGYVEGRMFEIERGTTEEVSFNLANSGYHRIDKVVARYLEEDGVESVYLFVVQGVEVLESVEIEPSEQTPEECVIFYAEITSSRADLYSYGRVSIVEENATCTSEKSFSHSEGDSTNALGECSHSEGSNSTANGYAAHAGGYYCSARGDQSFAHGEESAALGNNSVAIGRYLIANDEQTVFGSMNKPDDSSIFIIGNGNEDFDDPRRNAVEVKADGSFVNEGLGAAADLYNPQTMQPVNPSDFSYVYYGTGTPADAGYSAEDTYGKSFLNASTGDQFIVRRQETGGGYTYSFQKTFTNKKANELAPIVNQVNSGLDNLAYGEDSGSYNIYEPTLNVQSTNAGITITPLGNGRYNLNGTATADAFFRLGADFNIKAGTYLIADGTTKNGTHFYDDKENISGGSSAKTNYGFSKTITYSADATFSPFIRVASGTTLSNVVFTPMISRNLNATKAVPKMASVEKLNESSADYGMDNKCGVIVQGAMGSNGSYNPNISYSVMTKEPVPCSANDIVTVKCSNNDRRANVRFFNGSTLILASDVYVMTSDGVVFTAPANTTSVYVNVFGGTSTNKDITPETVGHVGVYINNSIDKVKAALYVQSGTLNDFNSYTYNGKFLFNNSSVISNAPSVPSTQGILEVVKSDAMIKQMFFHSNGTVFSRVSWFGSWRSWKQIDN